MKRLRLPISLATLLFALSPLGSAQAQDAAPDAPAAEKAKPAARGKLKSKKLEKGMGSSDGPVATFAGFRMLPDGSTRLFVELSGRVPVTKRDGEGVLTYTLKGARLAAKNNKNALVTTHFNTPVSRARLVPTGDDIEVVIELRAETTPAHRIVRRDGEASQLQIDFPAGTFPVAKEEPKPSKS